MLTLDSHERLESILQNSNTKKYYEIAVVSLGHINTSVLLTRFARIGRDSTWKQVESGTREQMIKAQNKLSLKKLKQKGTKTPYLIKSSDSYIKDYSKILTPDDIDLLYRVNGITDNSVNVPDEISASKNISSDLAPLMVVSIDETSATCELSHFDTTHYLQWAPCISCNLPVIEIDVFDIVLVDMNNHIIRVDNSKTSEDCIRPAHLAA